MCFGEFARLLDDTQKQALDKALSEGKSLEEAQKIAEKERIASGSAIITALGKSTAWGMTGAAVGSVVPVIGTAVGGTVGFIGGAISALIDPNPTMGKAASSYFSMLTKLIK